MRAGVVNYRSECFGEIMIRRRIERKTVMKTTKVVEDGCVKGKLSADLRGQLEIRKDDILRRIQEGTLQFDRVMTELQAVAEGRVEIIWKVDLDAAPYVPEGWKLEEHRKEGLWKFDPTKIGLYQDEAQKNGGSIEGLNLRKKLKNKPVMNDNLLDFYMAHTELIPESWKGQCVFFWGTIYRTNKGGFCARCFCWDGKKWRWFYDSLVCDWHGKYQAVVLVE